MIVDTLIDTDVSTKKKTHTKTLYHMNTRVFIQGRVSDGSSYATPINDNDIVLTLQYT